jgi:hypothetical protein
LPKTEQAARRKSISFSPHHLLKRGFEEWLHYPYQPACILYPLPIEKPVASNHLQTTGYIEIPGIRD